MVESEPTIAIMPCGDLFEVFFDTIGVNFEIYCTELTGGWLFNYIDALKLNGVRSVVFYVSNRVSETLRLIHQPTDTTICILPASKWHRLYCSIIKYLHIPKRSLISSLYFYLVLPVQALKDELKKQNCSAILFQDYENSSFDVCVHLGKQLNVPTFATYQGGNATRGRLEQLIRPWTMQNCAGVIIGSQQEVDRVTRHYHLPPTKISYIFNPLDIKDWIPFDRQQARIELGIPLDAKVIASHGRIDIAHKGLDILLEAWQQTCYEHPEQNLRLLLIGTGNDADKLQQMIQAMGISNIIWINEYVRDRTMIRKYLSAADAYALASRNEGFPVAPLEAMGCCLPIVATDVPGISDILEAGENSGGIIVPKEDPVAFSAALGRIIDHEVLRLKLGKLARQRVEQSFSLETVGQQMYGFMLGTSSPH
jgi:glycosyltransferase involved in cell wall biosynthesis